MKEAKEETGFDVEILDLLALTNGLQDTRHPKPAYGLYFSARIVGGELELAEHECTDHGWFGRHEVPTPIVCDEGPWLDAAFDFAEGVPRPLYFDRPTTTVSVE